MSMPDFDPRDYWRLRPRAPQPGTVLGPLAEIPDRAGREYRFGRGKGAFSMFVVRRGDAVRGYLNICPHFSLPLNYREGEFVNPDGSLIRCSMHFAEFQWEDGLCVAGACEGAHLDPVPVGVNADGDVYIMT
ncbi:MAG: Rieske 2Fe-2S domain-containing protein [Azospirillaceae bacterium]